MPQAPVKQKKGDFGAIIGYRIEEDGNISVLVVDYHMGRSVQIKLPGGMEDRDKGDKNPVDTAQREFGEEAGPNVIGYGPVFKRPLEPGHTQYFYASICTPETWKGDLRTETIDDNRPGSEKTLYPPRWIRLDVALKELFPSHRSALKGAIPRMYNYRGEPEFRQALLRMIRNNREFREMIRDDSAFETLILHDAELRVLMR